MRYIDSLPPLKEVISHYKLTARKSLGQNFLLDPNVNSKIVRLAGDVTNFDVLEIGPGPGGLTRALLGQGARKVVAVEKDLRFYDPLEQLAECYPKRLKIIKGDALKIELKRYLHPPIRIVANLPYNIGTEFLMRLLTADEWPPFWTSLTLMFQREVAKRITATHGSKSYSRLSIISQWRTETKILMSLSASSFTPRPKVDSMLVNFKSLEHPKFEANRLLLEEIVSKAFQKRRKMLRSALRNYLPNMENILIKSGISPTDRAEDISLEKFCCLARNIEIMHS